MGDFSATHGMSRRLWLILILSFLCAALLCCAFLFAPQTAHADTEDTHDHSAMTAISNYSDIADGKLTDGEYYLTDDINGNITVKGNATLCLNGHTVTGDGNGSVITVSENANFTLCDCIGTGVITGGTGNPDVMSAYTDGGGVYVGENSTFTMTGGIISGNSASFGGGVFVEGGTFTMYGGTIELNTAENSGGGVSVYSGYDNNGELISNGKFTMYDGTISSNEAMISGGVFINGGTFTMIDGMINGNTGTYGVGGVLVLGTFKMSGGEIIDNAQTNDIGFGTCGGVCVGSSMIADDEITITFEISGAPIITGNKVTIDGNEVENNVVLDEGYKITVAGVLTEGAQIGVSNVDEVITSGYGENNKDASNNIVAPSTYFISDVEGYVPTLVNGEVKLVAGVTHESNFTVTDGDDITYYETIELAWAAANTADTATVTMYADAEISSTLEVSAGNSITLDLNGCMLKYNNGSAYNSVITVNGIFTLKDEVGGGKVMDGIAAEGGGVKVRNGGNFTMLSGEISGNHGYNSGGGVCVLSGGNFTMSGGTISGNRAGEGGGVYVLTGGNFTMTGGTISDNRTGGNFNGGGVYVNGTFNISGTPKITGNTKGTTTTNNVWLKTGATITVAGELTFGALIGVNNTDAVATGFTQDNPANYFIPDVSTNNCVYVSNTENGTVYIGTHDYDNAPWTISTNSHWHECQNGCGNFVDAVFHQFIEEVVDDTYLKSAATCTEKVLYYKSCECGAHGTETFEYGEALGHDTITHGAKEPTCTEAGWNAYETCSRCDYSTKQKIPALGHDFAEELTVDKEATCTEEGSMSRHCLRCDEVTDITVIPVIPHSLTHVPEIPATEDKDGNKEYWECDDCHKYFSDADGKNEITDKSSVIVPRLEEDKDSNLWWIILIIVLIILIIVALILFLLWKKRKGGGEPPATEEKVEEEQPIVIDTKPIVKEVPKPAEIAPEEVRESVTAVEVDTLMADDVAETYIEKSEVKTDRTKQGIINIDTLSQNFKSGEKVTLDEIKKRIKGFSKTTYLKVLARGTLDKALTVEADSFSIEAVKMIILTGGKVIKKYE